MTIPFLNVPSTSLLKSLLIGVFLLFVADLTESLSAETALTSPIMEITFQDDLISAELVDAPLIDVLQRIKQEFGFKAHFHGDLSELITLSFSDMPLGKCLRQLTANHSLSVATRPTTTPKEQNEAKQITEIWVLSRSSTSKAVYRSPTAPVIPTPDFTDDKVKVSGESSEQPDDQGQQGLSSEDQLLQGQDPLKINPRQTIKNLAAIGDSASVMAMAEFLGDEDKEVRQLALTGISSVQNEVVTEILGQVLQTESDPDIRMIALSALGQRKDDVAAQAFLEGALNDTDEEVKNMANQLLTQ